MELDDGGREALRRLGMIASVMLVGLAAMALARPYISAQVLPQLPGSLPDWYSQINLEMQGIWNADMPYAAAAVTLSFAVAGAIFMVGSAAKNDKIREFGTGELYEALASGIIVLAFLYVSAVLFGVVPGFVTGNYNPYAISFNFILSTLQQAEALFSTLFQLTVQGSFYTSLDVKLVVGEFSTDLYIPVFAAVVQLLFIQPAVFLLSFIKDAIIVLYGEYYVLVFFSVAAIPVFLVPGVILRAIMPTRGLGGMLIAMAMAFYLVMPTLFAVAFYFTAPSTLSEIGALSVQLDRYAATGSVVSGANSPTAPLVSLVQNVPASLNGFWLMMLFYPMLILAVAYAFIVQVANFIGGASNMSGRLRAFL